MNNLLIGALFFFSMTLSWTASAQHLLVYSQAADKLHIADQVSMWHSSFRTGYRDYWQQRFGYAQVDKRWFDGFATIRRKYSPDGLAGSSSSEGQGNSILWSRPELATDPLADAFFTSSTIEQALQKLRSILPREEHQYLTDFFHQYEARFKELTQESASFRTRLPELQKELSEFKFDVYLRRVETYLGVESDPQAGVERYRSYLVWWPPGGRPEVGQLGPYILMRYNPLSHFKSMGVEAVMEGAVRGVVRQLSSARKLELENVFRSRCQTGESLHPAQVIELPLTLALSRMSFEEERKKRQFVLAQEWSGHPWVSLKAKLIYPEVRRVMNGNRALDADSLQIMATMCRELMAFKAM